MNHIITCSMLTIRFCNKRVTHSLSYFTRNILHSTVLSYRSPNLGVCMTRRYMSTYNEKLKNQLHDRSSAQMSCDLNPVLPNPTDIALDPPVSYVPDWTPRELQLTTCSEMWDDRPEGASFIVGYVDTMGSRKQLGVRSSLPTVLVVDGSVGVDMKPLLEGLASKGFRVVMPYLVGSDRTKGMSVMDSRRYSNFLGERASFLLDFIGAMNLKSIDVVVGHSFGCLPILTLASNISLFKSIVLICPIPGHMTHRWHHPTFINNLALTWANNALLRPIAHLWLRLWTRSRLPAVQSPTGDLARQLQLVMEISMGINCGNMYGMFELFRSRSSRLLCVYSDGDAMVKVEDTLECAELLGIRAQPHDETVTHATDSRYLKLLRLSSSSHFPPQDKQLCEIIVNEIVLLNNSSKTR